jgi:nicotinamidase/pyrazinamidase
MSTSDNRVPEQGIVMKKSIANYWVQADGRTISCTLAARLRKELVYSTSDPRAARRVVKEVKVNEHVDPVAIGDRVSFIEMPDGAGQIVDVLPRRNYLARRTAVPMPGAHSFEQVIAANVDQVVPVLNKYIGLFSQKKLPIFFSRDWHPQKTAHFQEFGGTWPAHCVQGTQGAAFHPSLIIPKGAIIISKGMDPAQDSYSAFQAQDDKGKSFSELLLDLDIQELYVGGLATDYCVRHSALDALKHGLKVTLLTDAIRGVDLNPDD